MKKLWEFSYLFFLAFLVISCSKEVSKSLGGSSVGSTGTNTLNSRCYLSPSSMPAFTTQLTHNFTVSCEETMPDGSIVSRTPRCFHNNVQVNCSGGNLTVGGTGPHSIRVNAVDSSGQATPDAGPLDFTVDTEGPVIRQGDASEVGNMQRLISINLSTVDFPVSNPGDSPSNWMSNGVGVDESMYYCAISTASGANFFNQDFQPTTEFGGPLSMVNVNGDNYFLCEDGHTIRIPEAYGDGPFYMVAMAHDLLGNQGPLVSIPTNGSGGIFLTTPPPQAPVVSAGTLQDNNGNILPSNAPNINNNTNVSNISIAGFDDFPLHVDVDCGNDCSGITEWRCSSTGFSTNNPFEGYLCPGSSPGTDLSTVVNHNDISNSCNHSLYVRAVRSTVVSNTVHIRFNADKTIPYVDSIADVDANNNGQIDSAERKREVVYQLYKAQTCASGTGTCLLDVLYYGANDVGCRAGMFMKCSIKDPNTNQVFGPYDCTEKAMTGCPGGASHCSDFDKQIGTILTGADGVLNPTDKGAKSNLIFEFESCDGAMNCIRSSSPVNASVPKHDPCSSQPSSFGCKSSFDNTAGTRNGTSLDPYDPYGPAYPNFPF